MRAKLLSVLSLPAFAALAAAQSTPPPIPVELRARFGFTGPFIHKIGDGIGGLLIADQDGDGKQEVLVADARRARITTLRWDGKGFATSNQPTDGQIGGYAVADFDGDRKPDLLLVDGRGRLHVRLGGGAEQGEPIDLGLGGRCTLLTGDLDGDGATDIIAASRQGLRWITGGKATPVLSPIEPLEENAHDLTLADFDGDGKLDLALVAPGPAMSLRLRRGRGDGTFGPWFLGGVDGLRDLFAAKLADGTGALGTLSGGQGRVQLHRFSATGGQAGLEWWAFGENQAQGGKALPFALGDFDGDGDEDLVLAQGDRARLLYFLWQDGTFVPRVVPTLAGVTSLAAGDIDGDGKIDLVLVSPEEDALAWKSGKAPLDAFPERLPCTDKPAAIAVDDGSVLVLARTEKREAHLDRIRPGGQPEKLVDLGRLPADPVRMLVADIGDGAGREVAFVVPGEGLRIVSLQPGEAGKPTKATTDVAGFTKKIEDGALALAQHGGKPALLVVRDRFLRVFRSDDKGQVQILSQDNGPEGTAELSLGLLLADNTRLYLDKKANKLLRSQAGAPVTSIDVPPFDFTHLLAHGNAALLIGPRGILRVPFGSGPSLQLVASLEPPTDRTGWWRGVTGDFDHDGAFDIAVLDGHLPGVQILAGSKSGLARALAMPVFEAPPSAEAGREPSEIAVGDVDGDGRTDLVLIAHDRVLIYLQEK